MPMVKNRKSLLSSQALIQAPWIKVQIGPYSFGVFSRTKASQKDSQGFYSAYNVQYPSYVKSLNVTKINGQINQYTLQINYPVKPTDDPNFFEKLFSGASRVRKITFSYGDASMPSYCYKDEEALILDVKSSLNFGSSGSSSAVINYTVKAVSNSTLGFLGNFPFFTTKKVKPSDEIKRVFKDKRYGLQSLFTGMNPANIDEFVAGDDQAVTISGKTNMSPLDYINYLVGCMVPMSSTKNQLSNDLYILTIHDDTIYDKAYNDRASYGGPYFKVTKTSCHAEHADAYQITLGTQDATAIVTNCSIDNNENYSLLYEYANELYPEQYSRKLNNKGQWEEVYAPVYTSKNDRFYTDSEDISWFTKLTKYPINMQITIQGLLRPATLMQYLRLHVVFPGGNEYIASGLYIITAQSDTIDESGYRSTLKLTRIDS